MLNNLKLYLKSIAAAILIFNFSSGDAEASANEISTASEAHPRLFFNADKIEDLRTKAQTTHQASWVLIDGFAESQLGTVPDSMPPPEGGTSVYRNFGNGIFALALAAVVARDTAYTNLAKKYLLTHMTWQQWGENNVRDLGHAHMLFGNSLTYDWLYDVLTPEERQTVRDTLGNWAEKMYEASITDLRVKAWGNWWRNSYLQNHHAINHSGLGMAGLALLGEDPRAQKWIDHAVHELKKTQYFLDNIEDGTWHEGINYQTYLLTITLPFMFNLRELQGIDLFPHNYLRNYPYFRIYSHLDNTSKFILPFGTYKWSWGNGYRAQNVLRFVAKEYNNGHAEWMAQQLTSREDGDHDVWSAPWFALEFLHYDASVTAIEPTDLPKSRVFSDLEAVVWRTGWEQDELVFALKTGAHGGRFAFTSFVNETYPWDVPCMDTGCQFNIGHNHEDVNGFYIYRAGAWLAQEHVGIGRWGSSFHNTILIDGEGQQRPPKPWRNPADFIDTDGTLDVTVSTSNFDYLKADATRRYNQIDGIENVTRQVLFMRPNYFVMLDNLAANAPHKYEWTCHFGENALVEGNWLRGEAEDEQILGVGIVAPETFEAITGYDRISYANIGSGTPLADVRFINVLWPTDEAGWADKPDIQKLGETDEAAAIRVTMNGGSRRVDDILLTYIDTQPVEDIEMTLWKFEDTGTDLGTLWTAVNYNDSSWMSGLASFGYGESYIRTELEPLKTTYYFRTTFSLFDPTGISTLKLRADYDDGFVAYLNGVEVARSPSMPDGIIAYNTLAGFHEARSYEIFDLSSSINLLENGVNVLAVEVHNGSTTSSDAVMDMRLSTRGTIVSSGPYTYDAQVAAASYGAEGDIERLFLYGGTFVTNNVDSVNLVSGVDRNESFEAIYSPGTVSVHSSSLSKVTLYVPGKKQLLVNDVPWAYARHGDYITFLDDTTPPAPPTGLKAEFEF